MKNTENTGAYSAANDLVDYILGITYEIWEEGQIELISSYYSPHTIVYGLDGITRGADGAIAGTRATLAAFPDRLLLGDDIIGSGDARCGYSSHRVVSPMTNRGASLFGPATGRAVRIMNMADCAVQDGVIVEEWLARDNLALVQQLGFDVAAAATLLASRRDDAVAGWIADETERLTTASTGPALAADIDHQLLLEALLISGEQRVFDASYVHYSVLHRSPVEIVSGQPAIDRHYAALRAAFTFDAVRIDHVCVREDGDGIRHVALRWSACGSHRGVYLGHAATGRPVYIMGVTHRRIINGRIAVEWTVFDQLAVLAQLL